MMAESSALNKTFISTFEGSMDIAEDGQWGVEELEDMEKGFEMSSFKNDMAMAILK